MQTLVCILLNEEMSQNLRDIFYIIYKSSVPEALINVYHLLPLMIIEGKIIGYFLKKLRFERANK